MLLNVNSSSFLPSVPTVCPTYTWTMLINLLVTTYCYEVLFCFRESKIAGNVQPSILWSISLQLNKLTTLTQRNLTDESLVTARIFLYFSLSAVLLIPLFYHTVISTHFALIAVKNLKHLNKTLKQNRRQNRWRQTWSCKITNEQNCYYPVLKCHFDDFGWPLPTWNYIRNCS